MRLLYSLTFSGEILPNGLFTHFQNRCCNDRVFIRNVYVYVSTTFTKCSFTYSIIIIKILTKLTHTYVFKYLITIFLMLLKFMFWISLCGHYYWHHSRSYVCTCWKESRAVKPINWIRKKGNSTSSNYRIKQILYKFLQWTDSTCGAT